jgi:hypothetical protein
MNSKISRYLVGPFAPHHVEKSCIHTPKATENEAESQSQLGRRAGIFLPSAKVADRSEFAKFKQNELQI